MQAIPQTVDALIIMYERWRRTFGQRKRPRRQSSAASARGDLGEMSASFNGRRSRQPGRALTVSILRTEARHVEPPTVGCAVVFHGPIAGTVRKIVTDSDRDKLFQVRTPRMDDGPGRMSLRSIARRVRSDRMVLAAIGVYGSSPNRRHRSGEIGIRRHSARNAVTCLAGAGQRIRLRTRVFPRSGGAWAVSRLLASAITSPLRASVTFLPSPRLDRAALRACSIPARRRHKVNPIEALRYE